MSGPLDFEPPKPGGGGGAGDGKKERAEPGGERSGGEEEGGGEARGRKADGGGREVGEARGREAGGGEHGGVEEREPQPGAGRGWSRKGAPGPEPEAEGRPGRLHPDPAPGAAHPRERALPGPPPPARPPGASRYGWLVGVLVVVILAYILQNTLRSNHLRAGGPEPGTQLHPFAAPLLLSTLNGDVNVDTKRACRIHLRGALNMCDVERRGPVVLGFLFTRGAKCDGSFDAMQRLHATMPGVQFVGVVVKGDRAAEGRLARQHGWRFPLVFDHDGGLADVYGVAGCPEVVLAYPGGKVRETVLGRDRAERQLPRRVGALVAGSKRRGWRPPA